MAQESKPSQILLWSQPRTACHLLQRMLTMKQDNVQTCWHPYVSARPVQAASLTEESISQGIPEQLRSTFTQRVEAGNGEWQKSLKEASEAKRILFVHEHPHFALDPDKALAYVKSDWHAPTPSEPRNYTLMPDSLLLHPGTIPVITFRHPASTAYTCYKGMANIEGTLNLSNILVARHIGWVRELYDWYVANGITPVLLEAEDYMTDKDYVKQVAKEIGLAENKCAFQWKAATEDEIKEMHPMYVKLQGTLINSTGIVEGKARHIKSIEGEESQWREELGEHAAKLIRELATVAMPDYEYLIQKKFKV